MTQKKLLQEQFIHPPDEFSPVPFWFWNDRLTKDEIVRQIRDFRDKGVMGFVIHPRIGIPKDIAYLSDEYMDLVETAVSEAERLGMAVFLYDEAMYPSGSAKGLVVKENREFASRALRMTEHPCSGSTVVKVRLDEGDRFVSAMAVNKISEREIDPRRTVLLAVEGEQVRFDPPGDGEWSILLFVETYSKGTIRGIHFGEDDGEPEAPASADLLNPDAVRAFIRITHERYYERLGRYFGGTILAFFTDEPNILGRGKMRGLKPWTNRFLEYFLREGNAEQDLAALWFEAGENTALIRKNYRKAVNKRLAETYYKPLSDWCAAHGIALTGHPEASEDIGLLEYFQIPGQDIVWRWVAPEDGKALEGAHCTQAKCSSDAARHRGRRRNLNECFGVCGIGHGWNFTADDMKWYLDWLFVRGVNLIVPHAFYYSIEGDRRRNERPPDVGPNNIWWPYYRRIAQYIKRMSWLLTDGTNVTPIAVLCEEDHLPWRIVKPLYEHQIEFNYLEEHLLVSASAISGGNIAIGRQNYRIVLVENPSVLEESTRRRLREFLDSGGSVIVYDPDGRAGSDLAKAHAIRSIDEVIGALDRAVARDCAISPRCPDLRVTHIVKGGLHFYLLVNEGEQPYEGTLYLRVLGKAERWDAWEGAISSQPAAADGDGQGLRIRFRINRRESAVFCIDPEQKPETAPATLDASGTVKREAIRVGEWTIAHAPVPFPNRLVNWTELEGMEHFSGTIVYESGFELGEPERFERIVLDLGAVHEIAEVRINGREAGVGMWAPYTFDISRFVKSGSNRIEIAVTNSLANRYDGLSLPSGLIGPVRIEGVCRR